MLTKNPVCFIIIYVNKKRLRKSQEFTGSIVERRWCDAIQDPSPRGYSFKSKIKLCKKHKVAKSATHFQE